MVAAVSIDPTYSGPATPCVGGVYVSTNGGTTWTRWLARDQVDDVSFGACGSCPSRSARRPSTCLPAYATRDWYRGEIVLWPNGAYGPGTWQQVAGGLPTSGMSGVSVAVAPSDPSRLYAMLGLPEGNPSDLLGAWTSADGGQSWTPFTPPHASWLGLALQVDPANARTLYVGSGVVWRVDDAGGSSTVIADTSKIHIDVRALAFDAAHRLYIATDGGLVSTLDDQAFTSANGNLAISQVYPGVSGTLAGNGALAPGGPFLAGLQDNGTARFDGPQVWHAVGYGGDGGFTAIDPTHVNTQYVTAQDLTVFKTDDGANFSGAGDSRWATEPTLWIAPLVMDTSHPDHLYAGTDKVYRSINAASSWDPISPAFGYTDKISAIAPAASDEQVVYAGTTELGIETTGDGGTDWTSGAGLPERSVNDIAVNPSNASEAWAALGGFGSGHLFHTTDEGQTWTDISGDLPDSPVNAVAVDTRYHPALIFVGTDVGVFLASQGSTRWAISGGLPNSPVTDLLVDRSTNQLVAATYGRGVWASTERRYLRFRRPPAIGSPRPVFGGFGG